MLNFILPISSMVFAGIFLIFSLSLPKAAEGIGPGGWPTAILTLMFILGTVLLIRAVKEQKRQKPQEPEPSQSEQSFPHRHWVVGGIIFIYLFAMQYVGMMLITPFFMLAVGKTLGMRGWVKLTVIALLCTAFIIGLFGIGLTLTLPRGIGIFRSISSMFY